MSTTKNHYSCAELAEMRLPGFPSSERRIRDKVMREKWEFTVEKSAGKTGQTRLYLPPIKIQRLIDFHIKTQTEDAVAKVQLALHNQMRIEDERERALQINHRRDGMSQRSELTPEQTLALAQELIKTMKNLFPVEEFYGHEDALMLAYHASIGTRQLCGLLGVN